MERTRKVYDVTGYCTEPGQVEEIVRAGERLEGERLARSRKLAARIDAIAAVCPHDDHLYSGGIALHVIPAVARAETVIIFGVMHRRARLETGESVKPLILDGFERWQSAEGTGAAGGTGTAGGTGAAGGTVAVDVRLRNHILEQLGESLCGVSDEIHEREHSIEGMLPLLQYYNPRVKILPVIVAGRQFGEMKTNATALADVICDYMKENDLAPGDGISMLISVDATHYGPDFNHSPFGVDSKGHRLGTGRDKEIGETLLAGEITESKVERLSERFAAEEMTWCGRYSVPFGLLAAAAVTRRTAGAPLVGVPLRYSDSFSAGVLPVSVDGLGITAPFSLRHWVGYWAILYGTETA